MYIDTYIEYRENRDQRFCITYVTHRQFKVDPISKKGIVTTHNKIIEQTYAMKRTQNHEKQHYLDLGKL